MPQKKRTKKSAKKTKAGVLKAPYVMRKIVYLCAGTCQARPKHVTMNNGDVIVLMAANTDVTIDFLEGSPFRSGDTHIYIEAGNAKSEVVDAPLDEFFYTVTCSGCPSTVGEPSMIVD